MWKLAQWIGVPEEEIREKQIYQGDINGRFAFFRLAFDLSETGELTLDISANSRYRLWVNEQPVTSGPCRGDREKQYYETLELGAYLRKGRNVIAAQVLLCDSMYTNGPADLTLPLHSVATLPAGHRLAAEGKVTAGDGRVLFDVTTGTADWRVFLDNSMRLMKLPVVDDNLGSFTENIDFAKTPADWKKLSFTDIGWRSAAVIEPVAEGLMQCFGILQTFRMNERPIPLAFEEPITVSTELGEPVLGTADKLVVPAGEKRTLLFDLGVHTNAYPQYRIEGGLGGRIRFLYFEKFVNKDPDSKEEVKRDDYVNGVIRDNAQIDEIRPAGGELLYEPFWYRTLRFLQIEIEAEDEALTIHRPVLRRTGYPLHAGSRVSSSAEWVAPVYEMCERTLQNCMMENYMDCPFWEQMQYPMDTRLQILFTFVCSADTKLARKALEDFHDSILPDGLIQGRAPSSPRQVISTFSLHYIFMIWEYYERTGDVSVLRRYRADVDQILEYYDRRIGVDGLIGRLGFWDFVDWQEKWNDSFGAPDAVQQGPSTIINLMYGYGLLTAAKICERTGRSGLAQEYRLRQREIADRIELMCWDKERQMYREGPSFPEFSQHAQSWAVLNGMKKGEAAGELMRRTFEEEDVLRCYFSTCYELFRACELAGVYELTKNQMEWWIHLLDEHCTTCPETPSHSRSECHAWSALPMYELISGIAGIRRAAGNPAKLIVTPHLSKDYVPDVRGEFCTEFGPVTFDMALENGELRCDMTLPEGMSGVLVLPDGREAELCFPDGK